MDDGRAATQSVTIRKLARPSSKMFSARRKQNGSLLYTLLPIQFSIQQFYEQKLAKLDTDCEQERIRKRLEALQQARQKTTCPPA